MAGVKGFALAHGRDRCHTTTQILTMPGAAFVLCMMLWLASSADAQTGAHGYIVGGTGLSECAGGCPAEGT